MLEISHSRQDGTLIEGTARGDGSGEVLKALRWRWSRNLGMWFVPRSRDRVVDRHRVEQTAQALRSAGFEVSVSVDDTPRAAEDVERDRAERARDRVQALEAKAQRRADREEQAWGRHQQAVESLPPGGEPVKVGHHSEGRHRRALSKAWSSLGRAVEASEDADGARRRADAAAAAEACRSVPLAVARRLERLEADRNRVARSLARTSSAEHGERLEAQLSELDGQIRYWQAVRQHQLDSGEAPSFGPDDIQVGAMVRRGRRQWLEVVRVNSKTVTVAPDHDGFPNGRVPYYEIQQVISAEEMRQARERAKVAQEQ